MSIEEDALIADALEVTVGNILSLKSATSLGVVTFDIWLTVTREALAIAKSRLPKPPEPDILKDHPLLDL